MKRRIVVFATVLITSLLFGLIQVEVVNANFIGPYLPRLLIQPDGSINPTTAPIVRVGNYYYLTDTISNYQIIVQCNNIVLDGKGFTIQGRGYDYPDTAIILEANYTCPMKPGSGRQNIVIENFRVIGFNTGIETPWASNCIITCNVMDSNYCLYASPACLNISISNNTFRGLGECITLDGSYNSIIDNRFSNFRIGAEIYNGTDNVLSNNSFSDVATNLQIDKAINTIVDGKTVPLMITPTPSNTLPPINTGPLAPYIINQFLIMIAVIITAIILLLFILTKRKKLTSKQSFIQSGLKKCFIR
jgi:parallel beta-helix repeat protein